MEKDNTLNGFQAFFDTMSPNVGEEIDLSTPKDMLGDEPISDEELEAIKNANSKPPKGKKVEVEEESTDDTEEEIESEELPDTTVKSKKKTTVKEEEVETEDSDNIEDETEVNAVTGFFDVLSEKLGWEVGEDEEKPSTAEDLIEYFSTIIEENSKPTYASEEIEKLDAFVKNGGDIKSYFQVDADIDLSTIELEDDESNQKLVLKEFLKEKGYSSTQIEKKLTKYADAGLLEDEASDALEALKDIREEKKEQLLKDQEKQSALEKERQQKLFQDVVSELKGMDTVRGIKIPEKDKKVLLEYIFKPEADGKSKYQKDFDKSLKNLLESAYFTMKGDTLLDVAKKEGSKDAINTFKNSLKSNGLNKKSKKEIRQSDDNIWSDFTKQLRML